MLSEAPLAVIATCVGVKHVLLIVHVMVAVPYSS